MFLTIALIGIFPSFLASITLGFGRSMNWIAKSFSSKTLKILVDIIALYAPFHSLLLLYFIGDWPNPNPQSSNNSNNFSKQLNKD